MATGPNLRVRISADLADVKQGLSLLRGELANVKRQAAQTSPDTARWSQGLRTVRNQLAGIVSVYAALRGVQSYTRLADDAANLAGRLRLATKSQDEFNTAHRETYKIAQANSVEWESIVSLYQRLSQSTTLAQGEVLQLTDTVSKAFAVSGAGPQDLANGMRQLSQALAGGVLRAEEFNSIIDTAPRIVQALADHFGIEFGKVRQYVNDGRITTQEFVAALDSAGDKIAEEYAKLPPTVGRAVQEVRNALLALVGDTDDATGASRDLANGIRDLARTLESPEVQQGFATFVTGAANATAALARFLGKSAEVTRFWGEEIAARLHGPADDDLVRIEQRIERMRRGLAQLDQVPTVGDRLPAGYDAVTGTGAERRNASVAATRLRAELAREEARALAARVRQEQAAAALQAQRQGAQGLPADFGLNVNPNGDRRARPAAPASGKDGARKKAEITEEEKARIRLAEAVAAYNSRLHETIELHGQEGNLSKLNYEILHGSLKGIGDEQAKVLREQAEWLDFLDDAAALEGVWAEAARDRVKALADGAKASKDTMTVFAEQAGRNMQTHLADFLFDPFQDGLRGMVRGFADALRRMAAEAAAAQFFKMLASAGTKNSGTWWGTLLSAFGASANQNHAGGIVGSGLRHVRNNLNPMLFGAAPRMHRGGLAGLAPDEVPTILQRGEEVLTRKDRRHRLNGGLNPDTEGVREIVKRPIVVFGEQELANALAGHAGEQVIITHMRNNLHMLRNADE